jgi:hypothetical protein
MWLAQVQAAANSSAVLKITGAGDLWYAVECLYNDTSNISCNKSTPSSSDTILRCSSGVLAVAVVKINTCAVHTPVCTQHSTVAASASQQRAAVASELACSCHCGTV